MYRTVAPLAGLGVGIISSVAVHQLVYSNSSVAVVLGAVNALAAWLVLRRWRVFSTRWSLWGGLFGGVLVAVPMFGIRPVPALSSEEATAIGFLVIGFGVAMTGIGIELALTATNRDDERVRDPADSVAD
ncbi:hypothetical protein [Halococcus salifodinae]|uniref:Uncharacterized protein n=1 Tax=Halococcus salifodinae DSM 8989 TaxID=1227456 RepID=M0NGB8_9EURY|nr:hypothetical protein [Halococcus salifodinae]EMA55745.1 hypothetical protein C450_00827 [Halococcus salifodinae DSM 8989]